MLLLYFVTALMCWFAYLFVFNLLEQGVSKYSVIIVEFNVVVSYTEFVLGMGGMWVGTPSLCCIKYFESVCVVACLVDYMLYFQ